MTTNYRSVDDIKACVTTSWKHHRCKFQPDTFARVNACVIPVEWVTPDGRIHTSRSHVSQKKQRRVGRVGRVVAVSCLNDGTRRIRGTGAPGKSRMFTRYYIQFADGVIMGYDSHHLNPARDCS